MNSSLLNRVQSESVPTVHGFPQSRRSSVVRRARGSLEHLREPCTLLLVKPREHEIGKIGRCRRGPHPDPEPRKLRRADLFADRFEPLMPPGAARGAEPDRAKREVHVVEHHQDLRREPSFRKQRPECLAASIHVGLRLDQGDPLPVRPALPAHDDTLAPPSGEAAELPGQEVHRHEAGVVAGAPLLPAPGVPTPPHPGAPVLSFLPPLAPPPPPPSPSSSHLAPRRRLPPPRSPLLLSF